ncbi:deoxygenase, partial [Candidatus Pelagibacter sp.]|nr:deoxygenase [Candidatus Pelagibacter sp.]
RCLMNTQSRSRFIQKDATVLIKGKFYNALIEKLKVGINKAKINPSPRFTNHTKDKKLPSHLEDF